MSAGPVGSLFGKVVYERQSDEDVVVLCINDYGLKPIELRMPHQITEPFMEELKNKYPNKPIVAIPGKSSQYQTLLDGKK